jgi:hypothetical protein
MIPRKINSSSSGAMRTNTRNAKSFDESRDRFEESPRGCLREFSLCVRAGKPGGGSLELPDDAKLSRCQFGVERGQSRQPIGNVAPVSIIRRAPPSAYCSLVSPQRNRTKPSPCLFRSSEERRSPKSCSSFRSSEEPHAGFTTVVLGSLTLASFGVLPAGCLRALVVARVGIVGPKLASRLRAVSSGAFTRCLDTQRLARQNT